MEEEEGIEGSVKELLSNIESLALIGSKSCNEYNGHGYETFLSAIW